MRFLALLIFLFLLIGCAVSPTGSHQETGKGDQEWLIKLATYRVRDETIIKSQDKIPLNMSDLRDLALKDVSEEDLIDLIDDLGVTPKLQSAELAELSSLGASPKVLQHLGETKATPPKIVPQKIVTTTSATPSEPLALKPIQRQSSKSNPIQVTKTSPHKEEPKKNVERENMIMPTSPKSKSLHPSRLSSDSKMYAPPINDPNSRR